MISIDGETLILHINDNIKLECKVKEKKILQRATVNIFFNFKSFSTLEPIYRLSIFNIHVITLYFYSYLQKIIFFFFSRKTISISQ